MNCLFYQRRFSQMQGCYKRVPLFVFFILIIGSFGCNHQDIKVNSSGNTIRSRIPAPDGYHWVTEQPNSFAEFLQEIELKPNGSKILDYNDQPISNQSSHIAVLNYDVGKKDLQQCADAVIRLRAEYLFQKGLFDQIAFHFTSGHLFTWKDYRNGLRPVIEGNNVSFQPLAGEDDSYKSFRKYLDALYAYAGTISLNKETRKVTPDNEIKAGDILIKAGSPGHAIIIVGKALNASNEPLYLLAEGYTPAQSIHVLKNDGSQTNPWYTLNVNSRGVNTERYNFEQTNIRSFE